MNIRTKSLFYLGDKPHERLIKRVSEGPYCHTAFLLPDGKIADSRPYHGFGIYDSHTQKTTQADRFDLDISIEREALLLENIHKAASLKIGYGWADLVYYWIWSKTGWWLRDEQGREFCSEAVANRLRESNIAIWPDLKPNQLDPSKLSEWRELFTNKTRVYIYNYKLVA